MTSPGEPAVLCIKSPPPPFPRDSPLISTRFIAFLRNPLEFLFILSFSLFFSRFYKSWFIKITSAFFLGQTVCRSIFNLKKPTREGQTRSTVFFSLSHWQNIGFLKKPVGFLISSIITPKPYLSPRRWIFFFWRLENY